MAPLPRTFGDLFRPRAHERMFFDAAVAFLRLTGACRAPIRAEGDLERMGLLDKVYWLYKATSPIDRARRGSDLEEFFAAQQSFGWRLPEGMHVDEEIVLSAAGDVLPNEYLARSRGHLYGDVADLLFGVDVSMANLECVIQPAASGRIVLTTESGAVGCDPESFRAASGHDGRGFSFLATANNHSLDFGAVGVDSTAQLLEDAGIAFHGTNRVGQDPGAPTLVRRGGMTLGIVSFTFGLNGRQPPPGRPEIVNRMALNRRPEDLDLRLLDRQLAACSVAGVDVVIAQLHWGMEHEYYPTPEQVAVAHCLAERGVDVIIGHHPHVVQPVEHYQTRRDPTRVVPIYYSLGNLINPCTAPFLCHSRIARLVIGHCRSTDGLSRAYALRATAEDVIQVADERRQIISLQRLVGFRPTGS